MQDKLGKQNFHEDLKKIYEPLTDTIKITAHDITKTLTESSFKINQAISDLNKVVLELMNVRGFIASYLTISLVILCKPENTSQFL